MEKIWKLLERYGGEFLAGLGGTLWLAAATVACGTVLGILVALLRMSRFRGASTLARLYTEVLRGTPVLLQLYFFLQCFCFMTFLFFIYFFFSSSCFFFKQS